MTVCVIGGGASGMAAALAAAENPSVQVVVLERQARVGKKLSATGNGRCNLTNLHADANRFHGQEPAFVGPAMERYGVEDTLAWFRGMGLLTVAEAGGRVYPYSDQANSVVDILRFALQKENITLKTGCEVLHIRKEAQGFCVETAEGSVVCDKVIVACGGLAGTKLGGSMSGYTLLGQLGHHHGKLRPALVQIKSGWKGIASLKGVRANCHVQILRDRALFAKSTGELQLTELGLSGPVIFEISRDVCQERGLWLAKLDFLPDVTHGQLKVMLQERRKSVLLAEELLTGILHNRLGRVLTKMADVSLSVPVRQLEDWELDAVVEAVKGFEVSLTEPLGMDSAQVTAGGVFTKEFDPQTMESKLVPGLYACGEVLDIDGDCGGYNLQWAWSSGRCAGHAAGKDAT